jgi:hypothetical protein
MSRGFEQATERNSAPRGPRDRERPIRIRRLEYQATEKPGDWNKSVNQTGGDRWCQQEQ